MSLSLFNLWSKALAGRPFLLVSPESQHFGSVTIPPSPSVEKPTGPYVVSLICDGFCLFSQMHVHMCGRVMEALGQSQISYLEYHLSLPLRQGLSLTRNSPSRLSRLASGPQEFTCLFLPCSGISDPHVCPFSTGSQDWPSCSWLLSEHSTDRAISQLLFSSF